MSKKVEKVQKVRGGQRKNQFGRDKRGGGVRIFKFFPNVNVDYFETVNASVEQKISEFLSDF